MKVSRLSIPGGVAGTDATVKIMRRMIESGRSDVGLRKLAEKIIVSNRVPPYEYIREVSALHGWVQSHVRYTKDPVGIEYIQTPRQTLLSGVGDCDDFTVLLGSMAESIGHPIDIKVVSRSAGSEYHHVYPVAHIDGQEFGLDASMPLAPGAQPPGIAKSKMYLSSGVGNMNRRSVFPGLGKIIPAGGDGATTGVVITTEPIVKKRVQVISIGQRICGADVIERIDAGFIQAAVGTRLVITGGKGITCVTAEPITRKIVPDQPVVYPRPPVDKKVVIDQPVVYPRPPVDKKVVIDQPVVYPRPPVDKKVVIDQPVVYPRPPGDVLVPANGGGGIMSIIESAGPLGLPWGVWIAVGLGALYVLKK